MFAKVTSAATQSGCFNARGLGGYVVDVLEKCSDIQSLLNRCQDNVHACHARLDQSERRMDTMHTTVGGLSERVDSLGVQLLQDNVTLAQRSLTVDRLKREIASKQERLERITQQRDDQEMRSHESSLQTLRDERASLERHLQKINRDIDTVYEDIFDKEQKLLGTRDARLGMRAEESREIEQLQASQAHAQDDRRRLLSITGADAMNLRDFYVNPADLRLIQVEIEDIKHRQILTEKQIRSQLQEREFMRQTTNDVITKVYDLERRVRKERGDNGWESQQIAEPNWAQTLDAPNMWIQSPTLSREQLKHMIEEHKRKYGFTRDAEDTAGTSGFTSEELVMIDMLGTSRS